MDDNRDLPGAVDDGVALIDLVAGWVAALPVTELDAGTLDAVIDVGCRLREIIDGFEVSCADQARQLEAVGSGSPAEEALFAGGRTRAIAARDIVDASKVTEEFPLLGSIVRSGMARRASVQAVVWLWRRLSPEERARFVTRFDAELADLVTTTPPDAFQALVRRRGRLVRDDDGQADVSSDQEANTLERHRLRSGRCRYVLEVDPLTDEELLAAVEGKAWSTLNSHRDVDQPRRPDAGGKAAALFDLVRAGAADERDGLPRSTSIGVIVDQQTLRSGPHVATVCETDGGSPVPLGTLARFACHAVLESFHLDGSGRPFDLGRRRRTATAEQRRALRMHYQACPLSGTPLVDCEIHHLVFWEDLGTTDYDNLVPLSRRWHHLIHHDGWTLRRTDDGCLEVRRPDGVLHKTVGPPVPITRRDRGDGAAA